MVVAQTSERSEMIWNIQYYTIHTIIEYLVHVKDIIILILFTTLTKMLLDNSSGK